MRSKFPNCLRCGSAMVSNRAQAPVNGTPAHASRGLCRTCYSQASRLGQLTDYPLATVPREIVLVEWELLRSDGVRLQEAAVRLGMTLPAFDRALHRAIADGDERGQHAGCSRWTPRQLRRRKPSRLTTSGQPV